jgi:ABC-type multidrug transport system permease subunit
MALNSAEDSSTATALESPNPSPETIDLEALIPYCSYVTEQDYINNVRDAAIRLERLLWIVVLILFLLIGGVIVLIVLLGIVGWRLVAGHV